MNDSTRTALARVEEKLEAVKENTKCLPELSRLVTRHDERLKSHWIHIVAIWSVLGTAALIIIKIAIG